MQFARGRWIEAGICKHRTVQAVPDSADPQTHTSREGKARYTAIIPGDSVRRPFTFTCVRSSRGYNHSSVLFPAGNPTSRHKDIALYISVSLYSVSFHSIFFAFSDFSICFSVTVLCPFIRAQYFSAQTAVFVSLSLFSSLFLCIFTPKGVRTPLLLLVC